MSSPSLVQEKILADSWYNDSVVVNAQRQADALKQRVEEMGGGNWWRVYWESKERSLSTCPRGCVATWAEEEADLKWTIVPLYLLILFPSWVTAGHFVIHEENDAPVSDSHYTQGLELRLVDDLEVLKDGRVLRRTYALRNLIYTPEDISISDPQPEDRPWAGLTAVSWGEWVLFEKAMQHSEWMVGVVGPASHSDDIQSWFHDLIGSKHPAGWSDQVPDEPVVNWLWQRYYPTDMWGRYDRWGADLTFVYGAAVGTAFTHVNSGGRLRAGWNMPREYGGIITPSGLQNWISAYAFVETDVKLVAHNITVGGSLFQDGPSRELERLVADVRAGGTLLFRGLWIPGGNRWDLGLTFAVVRRTEEFKGQDGMVDFAAYTVQFGRGF